MNKNVFRVSIILSIVFLLSIYVIKWFIPEFAIELVTNETIVSFGSLIDKIEWLAWIAYTLITFTTSILIFGAITERWSFNWKQWLYITIYSLIPIAIYYLMPELSNAYAIFAPLLLIWAIDKDTRAKNIAIVFTVNLIAQFLSLQIRGIETQMITSNIASLTILMIDTYIWLGLMYLFFNYQRKERDMGKQLPNLILYGKDIEYNKNKLAKLNVKSATVNAEIEEVKKTLAELERKANETLKTNTEAKA